MSSILIQVGRRHGGIEENEKYKQTEWERNVQKGEKPSFIKAIEKFYLNAEGKQQATDLILYICCM